MNGPEHYAEAERLLTPDKDGHVRSQHLERAAVHADLALTAAIAELQVQPRPAGAFGEDTTYVSLMDDGTWAGVIRSTIGDPQ